MFQPRPSTGIGKSNKTFAEPKSFKTRLKDFGDSADLKRSLPCIHVEDCGGEALPIIHKPSFMDRSIKTNNISTNRSFAHTDGIPVINESRVNSIKKSTYDGSLRCSSGALSGAGSSLTRVPNNNGISETGVSDTGFDTPLSNDRSRIYDRKTLLAHFYIFQHTPEMLEQCVRCFQIVRWGGDHVYKLKESNDYDNRDMKFKNQHAVKNGSVHSTLPDRRQQRTKNTGLQDDVSFRDDTVVNEPRKANMNWRVVDPNIGTQSKDEVSWRCSKLDKKEESFDSSKLPVASPDWMLLNPNIHAGSSTGKFSTNSNVPPLQYPTNLSEILGNHPTNGTVSTYTERMNMKKDLPSFEQHEFGIPYNNPPESNLNPETSGKIYGFQSIPRNDIGLMKNSENSIQMGYGRQFFGGNCGVGGSGFSSNSGYVFEGNSSNSSNSRVFNNECNDIIREVVGNDFEMNNFCERNMISSSRFQNVPNNVPIMISNNTPSNNVCKNVANTVGNNVVTNNVTNHVVTSNNIMSNNMGSVQFQNIFNEVPSRASATSQNVIYSPDFIPGYSNVTPDNNEEYNDVMIGSKSDLKKNVSQINFSSQNLKLWHDENLFTDAEQINSRKNYEEVPDYSKNNNNKFSFMNFFGPLDPLRTSPIVTSFLESLWVPVGNSDTPLWEYRDLVGNIQGPFSSSEMSTWFEYNFFPSSLLIRYNATMNFVPLSFIFPPGFLYPFRFVPSNIFDKSILCHYSPSVSFQNVVLSVITNFCDQPNNERNQSVFNSDEKHTYLRSANNTLNSNDSFLYCKKENFTNDTLFQLNGKVNGSLIEGSKTPETYKYLYECLLKSNRQNFNETQQKDIIHQSRSNQNNFEGSAEQIKSINYSLSQENETENLNETLKKNNNKILVNKFAPQQVVSIDPPKRNKNPKKLFAKASRYTKQPPTEKDNELPETNNFCQSSNGPSSNDYSNNQSSTLEQSSTDVISNTNGSWLRFIPKNSKKNSKLNENGEKSPDFDSSPPGTQECLGGDSNNKKFTSTSEMTVDLKKLLHIGNDNTVPQSKHQPVPDVSVKKVTHWSERTPSKTVNSPVPAPWASLEKKKTDLTTIMKMEEGLSMIRDQSVKNAESTVSQKVVGIKSTWKTVKPSEGSLKKTNLIYNAHNDTKVCKLINDCGIRSDSIPTDHLLKGKKKKSKALDPSFLGFSVKSNRMMQGTIDHGE